MNSILQSLKDHGALYQNDHLVLTSGKHSDAYVNLRAIAGNSALITEIGQEISDQIIDHHEQTYPDSGHSDTDQLIIVGPETIGRSLAQTLGDILGVQYVWCRPNADRTTQEWDPKLPFADLVKGRSCYIVDDVLTSAKTLNQTIDLLHRSECNILGAVIVVDRSTDVSAETLGIPWLSSLISLDLETYEPDDCPLCKERRPMRLRPGHGHEWIESHPGYPTT